MADDLTYVPPQEDLEEVVELGQGPLSVRPAGPEHQRQRLCRRHAWWNKPSMRTPPPQPPP